HTAPAGHAECADLNLMQVEIADTLKILDIFRIREWIPALDEVESQLVELLGNQQLVLQREVDAFALTAVAQGGVVKLNAGHDEQYLKVQRSKPAHCVGRDNQQKKPSGDPRAGNLLSRDSLRVT